MKAAAAAAVLGIAAAVAVLVTSRGPDPRGTSRPASETTTAPVASPAVAAATAAERQRPAATGGVAILDSAARAQAVLVGVVSDVASTDLHGWRAVLRVDRKFLGDFRLGATVTIGWEELSTTRQPRFANEQRVLLVLDALPTQSLWRKRFAATERAAVLVVAGGGEAFLSEPGGPTLDLLEHYLAMTASARAGIPGSRKLAEMVAGAHHAVAGEALTILEREPARVDLLEADGAVPLLAAARNSERDLELRRGALRLAADHKLPGALATARTLSEAGSPIRAEAYRALASFPDGLPLERVESLVTDADPDVRVVGAALLRGDGARARLVSLLHADPAPTVRLAAGRELLTRDGAGAIDDVIGLLDDPDEAVRSGSAESIGAIGDPAVAPLRIVTDGGSERAALAAVLGLARTGRKGGAMLTAIAASHQRESVRAFAGLALGEAPSSHKH
ncbi:MAG: HEAT repeat domain-containing protein [Candidatus Binatia bacterium]